METYSVPQIVNAELLPAGVLVTFDDGVTALYSPFLLHAVRAQAEDIVEEELF